VQALPGEIKKDIEGDRRIYQQLSEGENAIKLEKV
jgi:hypothetical protein